jgi:hypothetical protein
MGDQTLTLEGFVDRLLAEKGLVGSMEEEILDQMKQDLESRVEDRINAEMLAALPADRVEDFEALVNKDASNPDEIHSYLKEHVPGFDEVIANALMSFRNTYLNLG